MMYQCGRCVLTRASSQEPMGLAMPQCKCAWEFVPPVAPQRTWVGLTEAQCGVLWKTNMTPFEYYQAIEAKLRSKND